jgi:hypothetical protein
MSPPSSGSKDSAGYLLVSCLAYTSTLKMEAVRSSETSVDFQWTTRRYIPEDRTLRQPITLGWKYRQPNSLAAVQTVDHDIRPSCTSVWRQPLGVQCIVELQVANSRHGWIVSFGVVHGYNKQTVMKSSSKPENMDKCLQFGTSVISRLLCYCDYDGEGPNLHFVGDRR